MWKQCNFYWRWLAGERLCTALQNVCQNDHCEAYVTGTVTRFAFNEDGHEQAGMRVTQ